MASYQATEEIVIPETAFETGSTVKIKLLGGFDADLYGGRGGWKFWVWLVQAGSNSGKRIPGQMTLPYSSSRSDKEDADAAANTAIDWLTRACSSRKQKVKVISQNMTHGRNSANICYSNGEILVEVTHNP